VAGVGDSCRDYRLAIFTSSSSSLSVQNDHDQIFDSLKDMMFSIKVDFGLIRKHKTSRDEMIIMYFND